MRKIKKTKANKHSFKSYLKRLWHVFLFLFFISLISLVSWAFYSGLVSKKFEEMENAFHHSLGKIGFTVSDIFIEGRNYTSEKEIYTALKISDLKNKEGTPITNLDISAIQKRLLNLPWIKKASVSKRLPNILLVQIQEKRPIALWQNEHKHFPLDENGKPIYSMCQECLYLPIIVGNKAPQHTPQFIFALRKHPEIYKRTMSAVFIDSRRWDLFIDDLEDGLVVSLPSENIEKSLSRLAKLQKEKSVLDKQIKKLDLRSSDKIVITPIDKSSIIIPNEEERE